MFVALVHAVDSVFTAIVPRSPDRTTGDGENGGEKLGRNLVASQQEKPVAVEERKTAHPLEAAVRARLRHQVQRIQETCRRRRRRQVRGAAQAASALAFSFYSSCPGRRGVGG